uniref:Uncharacterized protein n=1 Tax=Amphilophus citrinellus TaxID=61819 RepID=A0A3Q0RRM8_AMPCI
MIIEKQPNRHRGICFCFPPQDALLRLAAVVDARSLRVALRDSIQELLPSTCTCVYLLEEDSRLLSEDPPHELPQEGKIRCIFTVAHHM